MAFTNSLTGRMEELRFPTLRSPESESPYSNNTPGSRESNPYFSNMQTTSNDGRGSLQRRFTTDSSKMASNGRPFGQQYNSTQSVSTVAQIKNKQMYEDIQNAKRKAEEQLRLLEMQERSLQMGVNGTDLERISSTLNRISLNGPVSEPTTPPEYAENSFSNRYSRSSHLSMNSVISPPGLSKRVSQTSSQVTSPPTTRYSGSMFNQSTKPSAKSVPGSRRGSDEDEYYPEDLPAVRSAAVFNRFSMPANGNRGQRYSMGGMSTNNGFNPLNTTSFLFDENEEKHLSMPALSMKSPLTQAYAALDSDDTFPTLTSDGLKLSANSAALDLANSRTPDHDWLVGSRYRPSHQSMPHTDSSMYRPVLANLNSPPSSSERATDLNRRKSQRHSMGIMFEDGATYDQTPLPNAMSMSRPASLQTSYSTNDVPTVKKALNGENMITPPKSQADQQFHNHNVSLGRIPANVINRQSRELINGMANLKVDEKIGLNMQSNLQASAAPFGPGYISASDNSVASITSPSSTFATPPTYPYNMQNYNVGQLNPQNGFNGVSQPYAPANATSFAPSANYPTYNKQAEATPRSTGRRNHDETRFNNVPLESFRGNLYDLCKDQHGCRYLQRKLEEGNAEHIQIIFAETCPHIVELMTDPFGNYLCQKLFEHCNQEQRTALINTASPALTVIALNQHGTRALQKMIEFVQTPEQIDTIIRSLSERVVELVQDLNGNHVVQKCLTRLGAERSQFIYDAVGTFCVVVGTHRHGCCVLQRCIDHSQGFQRAQLIARITHCAFELVQDPFGNYVVQYILDLDEPSFTRPLCQSFAGKICALSKQKFSSNVIEKCLRTADAESKRIMVEEMMMGNELEKMLRDSFANYVVQTAMEFVDPHTKNVLVEAIRPILPLIKQTPHGRRIASKILGSNDTQGRVSGTSSGQMTPNENFTAGFTGGRSGGRRQIQIVGGGFNLPRFPNGVNPVVDTDVNNFANGHNMTHMHATPDTFTDPSHSIYSPQPYSASTAQNGFAGFNNGHPGNGYI